MIFFYHELVWANLNLIGTNRVPSVQFGPYLQLNSVYSYCSHFDLLQTPCFWLV